MHERPGPRYRVDIDNAHAHLFRVTLTIPRPAARQIVALPMWTPGSYLVREFSRHLSDLRATQCGQVLAIQALDKCRWQIPCDPLVELQISYRIYAFDGSVRGAFLDSRRAFFNGTSLFLQVQGQADFPHELSLGALPEGWQVATAMPETAPLLNRVGSPVGSPAGFCAADYDELVDHPFEMGPLVDPSVDRSIDGLCTGIWRGSFSAGGVAHELVVSGALPSFDGERLLQDTRRICEQHLRFWHGTSEKDAPFKRYVFLLHAADEGCDGLEHRASTALSVARRDLPRLRMEGLPDGCVGLLGLISHEYFHAWNVKRLRPASFVPLDYWREVDTRLLWFFEGLTAYFDELALLRAGLIDLERYLKLVSRSLQAVAITPGRRVQSLVEAGFDAWIKYYRADENSANATVSYYQKGALVALALDLSLRRDGSSLDALMRKLWQHSGAGTEAAAAGAITDEDIAAALRSVSGRSYQAKLASWVHGTDELPLADLLADLGVQVRTDRAGFAASLGLRLSEGPVTGIQVKAVLTGSVAAAAGVSAGDELLAIDGWRIRRFDEALAWVDPARAFDLLLVREQRVLTLRLHAQVDSPLATQVVLQAMPHLDPVAAARRRAWLDV